MMAYDVCQSWNNQSKFHICPDDACFHAESLDGGHILTEVTGLIVLGVAIEHLIGEEETLYLAPTEGFMQDGCFLGVEGIVCDGKIEGSHGRSNCDESGDSMIDISS
jgi:hypothetical protein